MHRVSGIPLSPCPPFPPLYLILCVLNQQVFNLIRWLFTRTSALILNHAEIVVQPLWHPSTRLCRTPSLLLWRTLIVMPFEVTKMLWNALR